MSERPSSPSGDRGRQSRRLLCWNLAGRYGYAFVVASAGATATAANNINNLRSVQAKSAITNAPQPPSPKGRFRLSCAKGHKANRRPRSALQN